MNEQCPYCMTQTIETIDYFVNYDPETEDHNFRIEKICSGCKQDFSATEPLEGSTHPAAIIISDNMIREGLMRLDKIWTPQT